MGADESLRCSDPDYDDRVKAVRGKRQWASYDADIDAAERAELRLAAAMPGALENGDLRVDYQPVVALEGGRLVGVEAVLRWQHPQLDALSHERCAQLAEQTGVVHAVGLWWLRTAAEAARSWRQGTGDAVPPVALDLTSSQAQDPDLVAKVRTVLAQADLRPADLELRMPLPAMRTVTGASVGKVGADAEDNLGVLAEMGVRTALHDFACGAGELACLPELPVHAVRIAPPVARRVATMSPRSRRRCCAPWCPWCAARGSVSSPARWTPRSRPTGGGRWALTAWWARCSVNRAHHSSSRECSVRLSPRSQATRTGAPPWACS